MVLKALRASFSTFFFETFQIIKCLFSKLENVNTFKLEVLAVVRFENPKWEYKI